MGLRKTVTDGKYTKSDLKIMEFMEENTDAFLFMSIGQLAEYLQMSEATISRCAKHLGYHDFKEMKNNLIERKSGHGAARKIAGTLLKDQGFNLEKWFAGQKECMERTLEHTDMSYFQKAVDAIGAAKRIFIHARNASASAGQLLFFRLRRLGFDVFFIPSGGSEIVEGLLNAGKGDLVILFSYAKVSKEGRMILEYAKTAGYTTLAFTSRLYLPQEQTADIQIYVYRGEKSEYHSMGTAIMMIDAVILALSEKLQSRSAEKLLQLQKLKKFYKQEKAEP